jgi:hypothetical protein
MVTTTVNSDPLSEALQHARRYELDMIAHSVGVTTAHLQRWSRTPTAGSYIAPWILRRIARRLDLDEAQLLEQRRDRQRRDDAEHDIQRRAGIGQWKAGAPS